MRDPEIVLTKAIQSLGSKKLDTVIHEIDSLTQSYPNFKLAHLVKGDLLLARAKPLDTFGAAPGAAPEKLDPLREEARARLQRVQEAPPVGQVPKVLWQLDAQQQHVLLVDTSKSTLYVFENVKGEPRYVGDYYTTIGKKGTEKFTEGDQRTPLGVYFVKTSLPKKKLSDFYGSGAYPLNYPNEWDRRQHRDGHGIWLHGTPSDTYSRPPHASNGCVVLANNDLTKVSKQLQIGVTPVIIAEQVEWRDKRDMAGRKELLHSIEQWRRDWASLDTSAYLRHYAPDFSSGSTDYKAWAEQKKQVNSGKTWAKVNLSHLSLFAYPSQPDLVVANFEQEYTSNNLNNRTKKRQYWIKRNNRWQIIYEGTA